VVGRSPDEKADPGPEIYLRRLPVEEALYRLDRYLDEVFVAGLITVRVVHGKGAGTLRAVVREVLSAHPLVKGYRDGNIGEGDAGVTVVEMEERWSRS
jgi:DNA mismatch repair protein MutS2